MSSALLRKSLELFKDDLQAKKGKRKNSRPGGGKKEKQKTKPGDQNLRKIHSSEGTLAIRNKKVQSGLGAYLAKHPNKDRTEENVRALLSLAAGSVDSHASKTIAWQHRGPLSKDRPAEKQVQEETVFTEEDFKKFEEEYFVQE